MPMMIIKANQMASSKQQLPSEPPNNKKVWQLVAALAGCIDGRSHSENLPYIKQLYKPITERNIVRE